MHPARIGLLALAALAATGCPQAMVVPADGGADTPPPLPDTGPVDAGMDATPRDTGLPDTGSGPDAGSEPDAAVEPDAGFDLDAAPDAPAAVFEENFDDPAAPSRWTLDNLDESSWTFTGSELVSATSCDSRALTCGDPPKGPSLMHSASSFDAADGHFTVEFDFLSPGIDAGAGLYKSWLALIPHDQPAVWESPYVLQSRWYTSVVLEIPNQVLVVRGAMSGDVINVCTGDCGLSTGRWYRAVYEVCASDGWRMRIFDRETGVMRVNAFGSDRQTLSVGTTRLAVELMGEGPGRAFDRIRVTPGCTTIGG